MPPDKEKAPPGGSGAPSKIIAVDHSDRSDNSLSLDHAQLRPRPIGPGEIPELRSIYWRQAALGHRLPAERGVIVIHGGQT